MKIVSMLVAGWLLVGVAQADDNGAYLDPYYGEPETPNVSLSRSLESIPPGGLLENALRVDPLETARAQTPVKSQGRRGTCSIFSSTALLEYNLKKVGVTTENLDLSEQWLEYITAGQNGSEGSWSYYNFDRTGRYGFVKEDEWAYNGNSWHPYVPEYFEFQASKAEVGQFEAACLPLIDSFYFDHCLIGQEDPSLLTRPLAEVETIRPLMADLRVTALENLKQHELQVSSQWVSNTNEIQSRLDQGEAIALDVTFFYEAWNHRKSDELGLARDFAMWSQGIVSYPSRLSLDYVESRKSEHRAGHSIVLVGYNTDIVIERTVADRNGQPMTVKTQGVYFFKNSWGDNSFGVDFTISGEKFPGFGMIAMDYAHEHGSFYRQVMTAGAVNN